MKPTDKETDSVAQVEKEWGGYTYEQLKFQILLTQTRIEFNKNMMLAQSQQMMQKKAHSASMLTRMLGALDYIDYGVMEFNLGRRLFRIFRK